MKVTKSMLSVRFTDLCGMLGIPFTIDQAIVMKSESYAILDFDRVNGGYVPVMLNYTTGTQSGFMRNSSCGKRLTLAKMYAAIEEWYSTTLYIRENGFASFTSEYNPQRTLEKSDVITVHARRYMSGSNTYHCVNVYINGESIGYRNNVYGYENGFKQTAHEILCENRIYVAANDQLLRHTRAKVVFCVSDVKNSKEARF